ncbi:TIGR00725 family protein [Ornithinimicrobium sp. W1665]|uniref:SLOG cluster 4 domain-containing protein n=1 Tax=Ornithinimicrobium sp. W1665 TaxID=3416666 RepID=UPI003CE9B132
MMSSPATPADRSTGGEADAGHAGYVGVVGPGDGATAEQVGLARDVGQALGRRGSVVVTGGLGGVMAAAAQGCRAAGGLSVGLLLPGRERGAAGEHHTVVLPTGLGELRNGLLVRVSDVVVAVGSSWGTLSEVALACRTGVPVVLLGWDADLLGGTDGPGRPPVRAGSVEETIALVAHLLHQGERAASSSAHTQPGPCPG